MDEIAREEEINIAAKPSRRIYAYLFDLALNLAVSVILFIPMILALINVFTNRNDAAIIALTIASLISGALVICFVIFYFVCIPVFWEGQTVGKRFFNIRIIDTTTDETPNAKVMFIREATRIVIFILTLGLSAIASFIVLLINEKHVTFHEQISSTRVVNVNVYSLNQNEQ